MATDEELLAFSSERIDEFSGEQAERLLDTHGDVYRAQLVAARYFDRWARRSEAVGSWPGQEEWEKGVSWAFEEAAARLRRGDFLPGGRSAD
jgi:hypothetical protein